MKNTILKLSGVNCSLSSNYTMNPIFLDCAKNIEIGNGVFINYGARIGANGGIKIGNNCQIGPFCCFETVNHIGVQHKLECSPISIGDNVWIGAQVVVLPGAKILSNTQIAAGAVVRGTVGPGLYGGVPAKKIEK